MKQIAIIYNPASGGKQASKQVINQAFEGSGLKLVFIKINSQMVAKVRQAKSDGATVLLAAGGDGTVNAVANLAVELDLPLAVLPLGTLNHFAKDIGLPLELIEAAAVIKKAKLAKLDYCTVNGRVFVNNSSIGIYPNTVLQRKKWEPKLGKWPAALAAALRATFSVSTTHLKLKVDNTERVFKTPLVFVGNNSYQFDSLGFTNRQSLTGGCMYLYVVRADRTRALLRLAVLAFLGRRWQRHDFLRESQQPIIVNSRKSVLDVAVDGEVLSLKPPLTYKLQAGGITVIVPS